MSPSTLRRTARCTSLLALAATGVAMHAHVMADASAQQRVEIRVHVPVHVQVRALEQPAWLDVSEADVARGYVDVSAPVPVEVVGNLRQGVPLAFVPVDPQVRAAHATPRVALLQGAGLRREVVQVLLRLELAADARPGRHPWPVQVSSALP